MALLIGATDEKDPFLRPLHRISPARSGFFEHSKPGFRRATRLPRHEDRAGHRGKLRADSSRTACECFGRHCSSAAE